MCQDTNTKVADIHVNFEMAHGIAQVRFNSSLEFAKLAILKG